MLKGIPQPTLQPATDHDSTFMRNGSSISITPPPAACRRLTSPPLRSKTAAEVPPLFTQTSSSSRPNPAAFLPFTKFSSDRSLSPGGVSLEEAAEFDFDSTLTGDLPGQVKLVARGSGLARWFLGSSDPVVFSILPSPAKEDPGFWFDTPAMAQASPGDPRILTGLTVRPTEQKVARPALPAPLPSSNTISKFKLGSIFGPRASTASELVSADELANLNIEEALFPSGRSNDDASAALQCLEINAETTIRRIQRAHEESLQTTRAAISEKSVQADELEASQTRNKHLKMQLADMAERAKGQEAAIAALRDELAAEKQRSLEEAEARRRSIRMVAQKDSSTPSDSGSRTPLHRNRFSGASSLLESEAGSEMSSVDSVFSEVLARESPMTSTSTGPMTKLAFASSPPSMQYEGTEEAPTVVPTLSCHKCHGVSQSEAWDVISVMKMESRALKERVEELEGARTDVLRMIYGSMLA